MKIAILTLNLNYNYGGILQAFAMQTVLNRLGHESYVIKKQPSKLPLYKKPHVYGKRFIQRFLLGNHQIHIFQEEYVSKESEIIQQNTQKFISNYINLCTIKDFNDLLLYNFKAIVVGSDQVWRKKYFATIGPIQNAFLDFAQSWDLIRISYAASFGTDSWELNDKETEQCASLIKSFKAVSVREYDAVRTCKDILGVDAQQVLDPTMLLCAKDYIQKLNLNAEQKSKGNLHCYILDMTEEKRKLIDLIASEKKLVPFFIGKCDFSSSIPISDRVQPRVETWLKAFLDSDFVITDSFHACVFSILFHKQFVIYGNKERGLSRFNSLLHLFSLEDRFIENVSDYRSMEDIDYNRIEKTLEKLRRESLDFIQNNLK